MFKLVVLFSVLALAAAKPSYLAYSAVPAVSTLPAYSSVSQYRADVVHGSPVVPAVYSAYNAPYVTSAAVVPAYAAVSQAPHSPAVVLDAVNGVPLDTPEVVAARVAHYNAKALAGAHHLAKRSVVAPLAYSAVSPVVAGSVVSPYVTRSVVSPVAYSSPYVSTYGAQVVPSYAYSSVYPRALSVHPW